GNRSSGGASSGGGMAMMGSSTGTVSYLSSSNNQYNVVPVSLAVLIDQNSINDLLIELANSPMAIQVIDYEHQRPSSKVVKPVKGESYDGTFGFPGAGYGGMRDRTLFNMQTTSADGVYGGGAAEMRQMMMLARQGRGNDGFGGNAPAKRA